MRHKREKKDLGRSPEQSQVIIQQEYSAELMLNYKYQDVAKQAFMGNPDGFSVVDRISDAFAKIPYRVYQLQASGKKKYFKTHPVLELIKRPNLDRGQYEYMYELMMFYLLSGKMWQRKIDVGGFPKRLFACNPDMMGMYLGQRQQLGWVFDYNREKIYYKKEELSYLKFPHPLDE